MEQDNATKRAARSTDPGCPGKKQRTTPEVGALPPATGYDVQKIYYERFVEEWQRQENVSIVSALRQPTQEEFGKISYHAELRLDGTKSKAPRLWLKRPQQNSYSKRYFCRFGSDRFLFVNIPQRLPADFHGSHLQHLDLFGRNFRFLVAKFQSSWAKDAKGAKMEREDCFEKSWIKSSTISILFFFFAHKPHAFVNIHFISTFEFVIFVILIGNLSLQKLPAQIYRSWEEAPWWPFSSQKWARAWRRVKCTKFVNGIFRCA